MFDLNSVTGMSVERKKKLMPLISGGILASLALLAILLFGASMNITVLVAAGMLLFYFGLYEYPVLHLTTTQTEQKIWLPHSQPITNVRPFVGLIEYYAKHKHFPVLYTSVEIQALNDSLTEGGIDSLPDDRVLEFTFFAAPDSHHTSLGIDITKISNPIVIKGDGKIIGTTTYKINKEAIIDVQEPK